MKNDFFLHEAKKIGDQIILKGIECSEGTYWEMHHPDPDISKEVGVSLYNGNAGVAYFLLELYQETQHAEYLKVACSASDWIMASIETNDLNNLSFYTGNGGVIKLLLQLHLLTNNDRYRDFAVNLMKNCLEIDEYYRADLLSGVAGSLLALIQISDYINEDWVYEAIFSRTDILISRSIIGKDNICWDRLCESTKPLCGFSHGVSGVAFVLLELYKRSRSDFFLWMARNAFAYEDSCYSSTEQNWPDFRVDGSEDGLNALIDIYPSKKHDDYTDSYMCAWCHGATGIGMARLHAYHLTNENRFLKEYYTCIETMLKHFPNTDQLYRDWTLCHGIMGGVNLLLDGYVVLNDNNLYEEALKWGRKCVNDSKIIGGYASGFFKISEPADCSLFVGIAGIGHTFLRLHNPAKIGSFLAPKSIDISNDYLIEGGKDYQARSFRFWYSKLFTNCAKVIDADKLFNREINLKSIISIPQYIIDLVEDHVREYDDIKNIFAIDKKKLDIFYNIDNDVFFKVKCSVENLEQMKINLTNDDLIVNSSMYVGRFSFYNQIRNVVLVPAIINQDVYEYSVGDFQYEILSLFQAPDKVYGVYEKIFEKFDVSHADLYPLYIQGIEECIRYNFLVKHKNFL